jgi:hypothetical protein
MQQLYQSQKSSKKVGRSGRDVEKEMYWRKLVLKFDDSGMSVSRFCAEERINESNFYSWRKVIRQRDAEQVSARVVKKPEGRNGLFVPVRIDAPQIEEQLLDIELPGGARVKVTGKTNLALLSAILKFLGRE